MPLRLFRGEGSHRVRACPACESRIAADATFCPSCFLVIRPEGAADLRAHLGGGRIPTDVYLLRKLQVEDPDTGPVVRVPANAPVGPAALAGAAASPEGSAVAPSQPEANGSGGPPASQPQSGTPPGAADASGAAAASGADAALRGRTDARPKAPAWTGVRTLVKFNPPLPPPVRAVDEVPALFKWLLERDPVIPNNIELLERIHARAFPNGPGPTLGYEQHVLLLIADDLLLHPTQETLAEHLALLAEAYRRAAVTYYATAEKEQAGASIALWEMSSIASRLRVEAWVHHTRHGVPPQLIRTRRPRGLRARRR